MTITPKFLTGRTAKCRCGSATPSAKASAERAMFEYCGPGSRIGTEICQCGYANTAHTAHGMAGNVPSNRRTVIEQGKCSGFVARGPLEFDCYWCGCGNTD